MDLKRNLRVFYHRRLRDQDYLVRMGIVAGFVILMTVIIPRSVRMEYRYEVGQKWVRRTLVAERDFQVLKDRDSLLMEKQKIAASVSPILTRDTLATNKSAAAARSLASRLGDNLKAYREIDRNEDSSGELAELRSFFYDELEIDPELFPDEYNWIPRVESRVLLLIRQIHNLGYTKGIDVKEGSFEFVAVRESPTRETEVRKEAILVGPGQLQNWLNEQMSGSLTPTDQLVQAILKEAIIPNLAYDPELTRQAREELIRWVSPVKDRIEGGTIIVRDGQQITREISDQLDAYFDSIQDLGDIRPSGGVVVGRFFLIFLITMLMLTFLRINRPQIYFSNQRLSLVLTTILLVVGAMVVATKLNDVALRLFGQEREDLNLSYIFLAPACIVPIFMNNFFDHRVAFFSNLVVAFSGGVLVQLGLEYAFVQLIAGTVAVYSLRRLRKREVFFYTLGFIFLGYTVAYITFNLFSKGNLDSVNLNTVLLFGINVLLTIIAYNLIYLFEQIFRVTSDLTYLELLDTNHPLLKELAKKAPGTFQHSLQVANIAEAVVNEIGGNALLIHVGALYHDIGKMVHPKYFIENQADDPGKESAHDKLDCRESAEMIISHVAKGVSIAQRYHLPKELIHFIETHHGTTRVEFFYRKHLKEVNCKAPEDEEYFRYPGPLPFSKETAVLMLSDSVEAASRSLKNPTVASLEALIDKIVDHKISDDQLVNSPLTFRDISRIREVLKKQLTTIYHGRIEYPKEQEEQQTAAVGSRNAR